MDAVAFQPRELTPELSPRHFYGSEIRRYREMNGNMSLDSLASIVKFSKGYLSRIEGGISKPPPNLSELLDKAFLTDGHFGRLYPLAAREQFPDRWRQFMELAEVAVLHEEYTVTIPGLLQTFEVASRVLRAGQPFAADEEIGDWLDTRMRRQDRLNRAQPEARYWFILDEGAIRRPIGGPQVMAAQLQRLLDVSRLAHVTVQVLPYSSGEHSEMGGSLSLLTQPDGEVIAYEESSREGYLFDDPDEVKVRRAFYDLLRAQAASPRDSCAMIEAVLKEFNDAVRQGGRSVAEE
ncbi:helix-turn-helix domain-containing protein [Kitasatospora sp. NPDC058444]|uniref:helix-turn-helix domain-containing protein n=1 Tax=Kitasatospora sp. NPDC058444 TaxID=3346504 RepID=UPI00364CABA8